MKTVSLNNSSEFDQSPAKMFMGLFVLIALITCGFFAIRIFGIPEQDQGNPSNEVTNSTPFDDSLERDPDGGLLNDPIFEFGSGVGIDKKKDPNDPNNFESPQNINNRK